MQTHNLKRNTSNKKARQVGRGGSRGKTSGRGTKGQNARSGRKKRPEWRDIIKRLPKLRGRGKNFLKSRFVDDKPINLSLIDSNYSSGETVNLKTLIEKGLVNKNEKSKIKILGSGKLAKAINFENVKMSDKIKIIVEKAGGKIVLKNKNK